MADRNRHDDDLVELTRVTFGGEARAIKQALDRTGIRAAVFESDAGGWAPHFGIAQGNRVMVRKGDLAEARQLLSGDGGLLPAEEPAEAPAEEPVPLRKHLRRRGDA